VGAGELTLTTLEVATSHLSFLGTLSGSYSVWDAGRKLYLAEVDGGSSMALSVRPGTYFVHRRMPGWVDEARYEVREGETHAVHEDDFVSVPYEQTASRGDLERAIRRAQAPDLSLRLLAGMRTFTIGSATARRYLPAHPVVGGEGRLLRARRSWMGFDVLAGAGPGELDFEDIRDESVMVSSTSVGATVGYATLPAVVRVGVGVRGEVVVFTRAFNELALDRQSTVSLSPGLSSFLGFHHGRLDVDLTYAVLVLSRRFDDMTSLPLYHEPVLALGYRF
jgi:hypothetical protein